MQGITRYILRQLVVGVVILTAALGVILWLSQSVRFIETVISQGQSFELFLMLTALLMPQFLVIILPIALFAVVLFVYSRLISDRELVVLGAAGLGPWQLARPALLLAVALTAAGYLLTLSIIPDSVQAFRELRWTIRNDIATLLLREGRFTEVAEDVTVYVRDRSADGSLRDIMVHDRRDPDTTTTVVAEAGALVLADSGPRVLMLNGRREEVVRGTGQLSVLQFDRYTMDLSGFADRADPRFRDARERGLLDLLTARPGGMLSDLDIRRFRVEAHQRMSQPLRHLGLTLVALAFMLTGGFSRRGQTLRVLGAAGAMVVLEAGTLGVANLATAEPAALPLIHVHAALPILLAGAALTAPGGRAGASNFLGGRT